MPYAMPWEEIAVISDGLITRSANLQMTIQKRVLIYLRLISRKPSVSEKETKCIWIGFPAKSVCTCSVKYAIP